MGKLDFGQSVRKLPEIREKVLFWETNFEVSNINWKLLFWSHDLIITNFGQKKCVSLVLGKVHENCPNLRKSVNLQNLL